MSQASTRTHTQVFSEPKSSWRKPSMMVLLAAALLLFIGWAASFQIDQGVRASGQVISSAHTQIIQAVDGGVLSELRVVEGQQVKVRVAAAQAALRRSPVAPTPWAPAPRHPAWCKA